MSQGFPLDFTHFTLDAHCALHTQPSTRQSSTGRTIQVSAGWILKIPQIVCLIFKHMLWTTLFVNLGKTTFYNKMKKKCCVRTNSPQFEERFCQGWKRMIQGQTNTSRLNKPKFKKCSPADSRSNTARSVSAWIVLKLLLNDFGLWYVCQTPERFYAVASTGKDG